MCEGIPVPRTGRSRGKALSVFVGLVLLLGAADAMAVPVLEAELGRTSVAPGRRTTYTLTIRDAEGGELTLPRFGDLAVNGPSKQTQSVFRFVNGKQTWETAQIYSWDVQSSDEGLYLIGPAVLTSKGQKYVSNAVELTVEKTPQPSAQAQQPSQNKAANPFAGTPFDPFGAVDPFDAFDAFSDLNDQIDTWGNQRKNSAEDVFLTATVDKSTAFLGEQVTLSLYLMSRANISGVQAISFPKLDGFWAEDVETPTQLVPEPRVISGVHYNAYLLRRRALFPLKAGKLVIEPVEAQINIGVGLFMGARTETVKRKSKSVTVTVKPLPAAGQPPGFETAHVGSWSLTSNVPEKKATLGQPVKLQLTINGRGNVKSVKMPKLVLPPGLKTYDPTVEDKPRVSGRTYGGSRSAEWVIVPERTGSFTIPPMEFRYFDPASGTYKTSTTKAVVLEVEAGEGASAPMAAAPGAVAAPVASNVLTGGVRPVKTDATLALVSAHPWDRVWFWPVTAGPVAAWLLLLSGGWMLGILRSRDPNRLKEKRARGVAGKRLKAARERLEAEDAEGFLGEVERSLLEYVTDRQGVAARGLTRDELRSALAGKALPQGPVHALIQVLERCETARFMPGATSPAAMRELFEKAQAVVEALDAARNKKVTS